MRESIPEETLAQELKRTLTPVKPPEVFRDHLRYNLELAGRQQVARRGFRRRVDWARWWMAMGMITGTIGLASLFALILRSRLHAA
jgi:hypothetical protein